MDVLQKAHLVASRWPRKLSEASLLTPVTRSLRLWCIQNRVADSNERVDPVCLGSGPLDPRLFLGCELAALASAVFDGSDEFAQAVCTLQTAGIAKQRAQLATLLAARVYLCVVSGTRLLKASLAARLFLFLCPLFFGQTNDASNDAVQARVDEAAVRVIPFPRWPRSNRERQTSGRVPIELRDAGIFELGPTRKESK